ncbi:phosphotransferase [Streptomyces sp. NBC_00234]|uniref:phosphotransferase n=1 Tax=Streptomyces sp. NBC_00234 TaxID=2903638 RepID=UPI002E29FF12|nr:phosphotransferase [Streptomyces sp. NBC_00234]
MAVDTTPEVRRRAAATAGLGETSPAIEGPLKGHHHETYVIPLPGGGRRCKVREPRSGLLWFDRRCFASEDRLLQELYGRISRIPEIVTVGEGVLLQGFIEGRTLGRGVMPSKALSPRHRGQLIQLFSELVSIEVEGIGARRVCEDVDRPVDGDCTGFLGRLITFTEQQVYERHGAPYRSLFAELGVDKRALGALRRRADGLAGRSFALVHGDLHRLNFIVDRAGDLWTIDWELAMIGDPLYDLATHLHLMRYSPREAERIARLWAGTVESVRPECAKGWREDLEVLRDYKRVQSVYTDVIRGAVALEQPGGRLNWGRLPLVAHRVREALDESREVRGAAAVPTLREVMAAYTRWFRDRPSGRVTASAP